MMLANRKRMAELFAMPHSHPEYYRTLPELELLKREYAYEQAIATAGAFMMEGLRDNDYEAVLEKWDKGCLELVCDMMQYAPLLVDLFNAGYAECCLCNEGAPGVYEYEVTSGFGKWYGEYILSETNLDADAPTANGCEIFIRVEAAKFFAQRR